MSGRRNQWFLIFIIVIAVVSIWLDLPDNPGLHFIGIDKEIKTYLGLDLVGGTQALLEADVPESTKVDDVQMSTARQIIENRVNSLGVTEAVVQLAGDRRILVEIPGIKDPDQALSTIKGTALLEFIDMGSTPLREGSTVKSDYITKSAIAAPTSPPVNQAPSPTPSASATPALEDKVWHTVMTGADLKNAQVTTDQLGKMAISFELNADGANVFQEYTTKNVGKFLAISLDKKLISVPRVESPITEGKGIITGDFNVETANALAVQLRYGALPIPLKVIETRTVGPTLGQDSLQKSLTAGVIGLIICALFMALYYRLPGLVADVVMLFYALISFALFRSIPVTLTLSGIAGLMLSTGTAFDANILIFERFKEELRSGKNMRQALELGWRRAWPSIRDSNAATLITCAILFWFGSTFGATIVKGFAVTLFLGLVVSLFTAVLVTRTFLDIVLTVFKPSDQNKWFGL
ncbi:MAG: protein translocase subunit SecD [Chloroflexota bacterium]